MAKPICKKCDSKYCTKNGFVRGKQRYICKHCGTSFVLGDERGNVPLSVKLHGLKLYVSGLSMNRIAGRVHFTLRSQPFGEELSLTCFFRRRRPISDPPVMHRLITIPINL